MKPGIYKDLSNDDYHAHKDSISRSSILDFKKSPYKYWSKHLNPNRPAIESKPSWEFGTAFHTLILEPDKFNQDYFVLPERVLLKDVGRQAYDEYKKCEEEAKLTTKKLLSRADFERLKAMEQALFAHERAKQLVIDAEIETSYFWKDERSGLTVKSRPDIIKDSIYIDLKTIDDAHPDSYQREMVKFGYHIQAAMIKDAVSILSNKTINACINLCVEKTYPYSIGIYFIDDLAIEQAQIEYRYLLESMASCIMTNEFKDYEVQTIGLPRWY